MQPLQLHFEIHPRTLEQFLLVFRRVFDEHSQRIHLDPMLAFPLLHGLLKPLVVSMSPMAFRDVEIGWTDGFQVPRGVEQSSGAVGVVFLDAVLDAPLGHFLHSFGLVKAVLGCVGVHVQGDASSGGHHQGAE